LFRKILLILLAYIPLLYFGACTEGPSDLGSGLLSPDLINLDSLDSSRDSLSQTSSSHVIVLPIGSSDMLLLGKYKSNTASTLLSFYFGLADSIRTNISNYTVSSATVRMYVDYRIGDPYTAFSLEAKEIKYGGYWTSAGFTSDSLSSLDPYLGRTVFSGQPTFGTDSLMTFTISNDLVRDWLIAEVDTSIPPDNGILVSPTNNNGILGFVSVNSITQSDKLPILQVALLSNSGGWTDTLNFIPSQDLSVVKGNLPEGDNENLYVQSSVMINSVIKFNLNKLPQHAVINKAVLQFTPTDSSYIGSGTTDGIIVYPIIDSTKVDTILSSGITLLKSGNVYSGDIAAIVQNWISVGYNNGLLIRSANPYQGIDRFVLKGSNAPDAEKPRLIITYTNKL
jgi:hypothetical protein